MIACDGVNSFLAKEAGLYGPVDAANYTLGVKETLALPKDVIDERFGVRGREGVDIEILGGTGGVNGGGFVYTNLDTRRRRRRAQAAQARPPSSAAPRRSSPTSSATRRSPRSSRAARSRSTRRT